MAIKKIIPPMRTAILAAWEKKGATKSELKSLECNLADSCMEWCAVEDDTSKEYLAVFEIRDVPSCYFKNMQVFFSPDTDIDMDGEDFETVKTQLNRVISTLGDIFKYFIFSLANGKDTVKIYNENKNVRTIFYEFGNYLAAQYPTQYAVKMYRNWVEISKR